MVGVIDYDTNIINSSSSLTAGRGAFHSQLNASCSPVEKSWAGRSPGDSNAVGVYDTWTRRYGTVATSSRHEEGLVVPGCPPGLPLNCDAPQTALSGDALLVSGGECDPHTVVSREVGATNYNRTTYWHYPKITLQGMLTELA